MTCPSCGQPWLAKHQPNCPRSPEAIVNGARRLRLSGSSLKDLRTVAELAINEGVPLEKAVSTFERAYLVELVAKHGGNKCAAAREANLHRNTLNRKLQDAPK